MNRCPTCPFRSKIAYRWSHFGLTNLFSLPCLQERSLKILSFPLTEEGLLYKDLPLGSRLHRPSKLPDSNHK